MRNFWKTEKFSQVQKNFRIFTVATCKYTRDRWQIMDNKGNKEPIGAYFEEIKIWPSWRFFVVVPLALGMLCSKTRSRAASLEKSKIRTIYSALKNIRVVRPRGSFMYIWTHDENLCAYIWNSKNMFFSETSSSCPPATCWSGSFMYIWNIRVFALSLVRDVGSDPLRTSGIMMIIYLL